MIWRRLYILPIDRSLDLFNILVLYLSLSFAEEPLAYRVPPIRIVQVFCRLSVLYCRARGEEIMVYIA